MGTEYLTLQPGVYDVVRCDPDLLYGYGWQFRSLQRRSTGDVIEIPRYCHIVATGSTIYFNADERPLLILPAPEDQPRDAAWGVTDGTWHNTGRRDDASIIVWCGTQEQWDKNWSTIRDPFDNSTWINQQTR